MAVTVTKQAAQLKPTDVQADLDRFGFYDKTVNKSDNVRAAESVIERKREAEREVYDVVATADADAALVVAHTLGVIPSSVTILPIGVKGGSDGATGWKSFAALANMTATQITVTKATGVGSGDAAAQIRVYLER